MLRRVTVRITCTTEHSIPSAQLLSAVNVLCARMSGRAEAPSDLALLHP